VAKTNLSIRVDDDTRQRLDALAARADRHRSLLIEDALKAYLDHEAWLAAQIDLAKESDGGTPAIEHAALMAAVTTALQDGSS
jgi:predicted transcriptional regulator